MRTRFALCSVVVGLSVFAGSSVARAQPKDKAAADLLFTDAEKLVEAGQFAQACPKFAESQRLDPQLGTLLHLADCYEKEGKTASAWASFREAKELAAAKADGREQVAKDRAAALEPKLARLSIVVPSDSEAPGLEVQRDGQVVGRALWGSAVPIDPGKHTIVARAQGKTDWTKDVDVTEAGKTVTLAIPALAAAAALPPPTGPVVAPRPAEKPSSGGGSPLKTIGFVVAGVGAAGLVVGGVFAGTTSSKSNEANAICPTGVGCTLDEVNRYNAAYADAQNASTTSIIAFVAGGVLLAGGLIMVLVAPSGSASKSAARSSPRSPAPSPVLTW